MDTSNPALTPDVEPDRQPSTARAAITTLDLLDEPVAVALARGAATVDELVAVTGLTVAAVLAAVTRLEAAGLARGRYGRYAPDGALALAAPKAPPRTRRPRAPAARVIPPAA